MLKKSVTALVLTAGVLTAITVNAQETVKKGETMLLTAQAYKSAEFPALSKLPGFSEQLIANHIKLYKCYVSNTNALSEKLAMLLAEGKEKTQEYAELKRRFGWEFNGMRLHELYFGSLGGSAIPRQDNPVYNKIQENYGSFDAEFTRVHAQARGLVNAGR